MTNSESGFVCWSDHGRYSNFRLVGCQSFGESRGFQNSPKKGFCCKESNFWASADPVVDQRA